jgi:hypothetical protein
LRQRKVEALGRKTKGWREGFHGPLGNLANSRRDFPHSLQPRRRKRMGKGKPKTGFHSNDHAFSDIRRKQRHAGRLRPPRRPSQKGNCR